MRSAILKQSPCRTGRRKYGEMGQTSAAVRSTPVPQRNTPGKQVSQAVRTVMGAEDAALNDIIDVRDTALQTISDIFDALVADKERTDHGVPVEDWAKEMMRLSAEARPSRS